MRCLTEALPVAQNSHISASQLITSAAKRISAPPHPLRNRNYENSQIHTAKRISEVPRTLRRWKGGKTGLGMVAKPISEVPRTLRRWKTRKTGDCMTAKRISGTSGTLRGESVACYEEKTTAKPARTIWYGLRQIFRSPVKPGRTCGKPG